MKYFVVMIPKAHVADIRFPYAYCHTDRDEAIKDRDERIGMYQYDYDVYLTVEVT